MSVAYRVCTERPPPRIRPRSEAARGLRAERTKLSLCRPHPEGKADARTDRLAHLRDTVRVVELARSTWKTRRGAAFVRIVMRRVAAHLVEPGASDLGGQEVGHIEDAAPCIVDEDGVTG